MMASPGSGHRKSQAHQDQVTRGNIPFLHSNAVSVAVRYVKDFVMTKKCSAGQLVVRKHPESRVLAISFPPRIFMCLLVGLRQRERKELTVANSHVS